MAQEIQAPAIDGAWTWHQDPRALHKDGVTYVCYVNSEGSVGVTSYNHTTEEQVQTILKEEYVVDDHTVPSILFRDDGRAICFYTREFEVLRYRIADNPDDISSFGVEQTIDLNGYGSISYAQAARLPSEANDIYLFWRGSGPVNFEAYYQVSSDGGSTWGTPTQLTSFGENRGYVKQLEDDPRIHLTIQQTNVEGTGDTDFWSYIYYEGGSFYAADGTLVADEADLPLTPSDLTAIDTGESTSTGQMRVWDLTLDANGDPRVLYAKMHNSESHEYYHARWDGTQWLTDTIVSDAGTGLGRSYYSGGLCFDGTDPTTVYYVAESGQHELYEATTADDGQTWTTTQVTENSRKPIYRPCKVHNAAPELSYLFLWGDYHDFTDYDQRAYSRPPVGEVRVVTPTGIETLALTDTEPTGDKIPVGTQQGNYWADLAAADTGTTRVVTNSGVQEWSTEQ